MNRKTQVMATIGLILVALVIAIGCSSGLDPAKTIVQSARADAPAAHISWQINSAASALANDGSKITLTGSGTFVAPAGGGGTSSATTGGGTWAVFAAGATTASASGNYSVTGLVRWDELGIFPTLLNAVGGLATLRVEYSDGSHGVLIVSCHAPSGSDPAIFEGITASKSAIDYWNRIAAGTLFFHD